MIAPMSGPITHKSLGYSFVSVEIEINHDCNRACVYCPNSVSERKNQGRMSEELFRNIMSQLREIHFAGRISYHFYNEPLLSPDLDLFVQLTKEYLPQCQIDLYTNGTLLTEERLHTLLRLGVDKFTVTHHHGREEYPFTRVFQSQPLEIQSRIKLQGFKNLMLTNRGGLVKVGQKPSALHLPCFVPSMAFVITVNGNIVPCFEDYKEQNVMGNLQEQSLSEIWHSSKYTQFRDDLKSKRRSEHAVCRDCSRHIGII